MIWDKLFKDVRSHLGEDTGSMIYRYEYADAELVEITVTQDLTLRFSSYADRIELLLVRHGGANIKPMKLGSLENNWDGWTLQTSGCTDLLASASQSLKAHQDARITWKWWLGAKDVGELEDPDQWHFDQNEPFTFVHFMREVFKK